MVHTFPLIVTIDSEDVNLLLQEIPYDMELTATEQSIVFEMEMTGPPGPAGADGPQGPAGDTGPAGPGVAIGGETGQILQKASNADFDTEWADNLAIAYAAAL